MKKFCEEAQERITGRTQFSLELTWDITGKEILNIGSLGWWFEDYIFTHGKYKKMVWLDIPWTYIKELQEAHKNQPNIEFIEGNVLELPFKKNSFDIVCMWEVLEHIPKGTELFALMEINRVLRKDGLLLLSTPHFTFWSNLLDPAWYFGHRHYKKKEIEYLLSESWFFDFHIETRGWFYELITMILFYIFKHIFRREIPFKSFFEEKRHKEFFSQWFTNIFLNARKNRDS